MRRSATQLAGLLCAILAFHTAVMAQDDAQQNAYLGAFWLDACQDQNGGGHTLCSAFLQGIEGFNDYMTFARKKPEYCRPDAVAMTQMREIFLNALRADAAHLHQAPASATAIFAFRKAFPCKVNK